MVATGQAPSQCLSQRKHLIKVNAVLDKTANEEAGLVDWVAPVDADAGTAAGVAASAERDWSALRAIVVGGGHGGADDFRRCRARVIATIGGAGWRWEARLMRARGRSLRSCR